MRSKRPYLLKSTLSSLVIFESVARLKSFTAAADELNMTQSAVSHAIKKLEDVIDRRLFVRNSSNISLTHEGDELLRGATSSIEILDETLSRISAPTHKTGALILAMSNSMARHWFLPRYSAAPDGVSEVNLWIQTTDRNVNLDLDNIDACISFEVTPSDGYEVIPLWRETVYAVCSQEYLDKHGPIDSLEAVSEKTLIHFEHRIRARMTWKNWFKTQGLSIDVRNAKLRYSEYSLAIDSALRSEGIVLGWQPVIDDLLATSKLVLAYPEPVRGNHRYFLMARRGTFTSVSNRAFRDWLQVEAAAINQ
jgi:DNA-binding transcriptional LysR family regulator